MFTRVRWLGSDLGLGLHRQLLKILFIEETQIEFDFLVAHRPESIHEKQITG
jgi:hypothetical protein